ncbi:MAG TPA: hypothetical protein PLM96_07095 [Methanoregulaceae archaeon]|nr:hypothetical protein [Methanoregulaceae archaeon]
MTTVRIYLNRGGSRTMSDLLNRFGDGKTAFILAGLLVVLLAQPVPVSGAAPDWSYTVGREYISSSDIASDGSAVVIGTTMGQLRLLDGDGVVLWTKSIPGSLMAEISPDNSCIIVASQESLEKDKGAVRGFDRNGTQMWREVTGWVTDIDLSADARNLVVGTRRGDVIVLDLNGDRLGQYNDFPKTYVVNAAGISEDGTRIAYSLCERKPALEVVTVRNGRRTISSRVENTNLIDIITLSWDGKCIATESGEGSMSELSFFDEKPKKIWSKSLPRIHDLVITEDGGLVLAASEDSYLRVYAGSGDPLWNFSRAGGMTSLSVNLEKGLIVSGSGDGHIDLLNLSGDPVCSMHVQRFPESVVSSVKISDDGGSLIAVLNDKEILYYTLDSCESPDTEKEEISEFPNSTVEIRERTVENPPDTSVFEENTSVRLWNPGGRAAEQGINGVLLPSHFSFFLTRGLNFTSGDLRFLLHYRLPEKM